MTTNKRLLIEEFSSLSVKIAELYFKLGKVKERLSKEENTNMDYPIYQKL